MHELCDRGQNPYNLENLQTCTIKIIPREGSQCLFTLSIFYFQKLRLNIN